MKKVSMIITTMLFALSAMALTGLTANASTNTNSFMDELISANGRAFITGNDEVLPFDGDISSLVREARANYQCNSCTKIYITDSARQIMNMMNDSEVVEVKYSNAKLGGLRLITNKNGEEIEYIFDNISWNHELTDKNSPTWSFPYENFMYTIFVKDNQVKITKVWHPTEDVYTYNLINNPADVASFKKDIESAEKIHFSTEIDFYPRLHAYIYKNDGTEVEYTMYYYNEKAFNPETSEIIGKYFTEDEDDEITFYVEDGCICADSALRSSRLDARR